MKHPKLRLAKSWHPHMSGKTFFRRSAPGFAGDAALLDLMIKGLNNDKNSFCCHASTFNARHTHTNKPPSWRTNAESSLTCTSIVSGRKTGLALTSFEQLRPTQMQRNWPLDRAKRPLLGHAIRWNGGRERPIHWRDAQVRTVRFHTGNGRERRQLEQTCADRWLLAERMVWLAMIQLF